MIYVSTACVKGQGLNDSLRLLNDHGFKHVECSGGNRFEESYRDILLTAKSRWGMDFLCHNYFPVPKSGFVLNLASRDDFIYQRSIEHLKTALDLSRDLNAGKFGCHAGFFLDMATHELGVDIGTRPLADVVAAERRFIDAFMQLQGYAGPVKLYIENNVLSWENRGRLGNKPFMLLDSGDVTDLRSRMDFNLLLDVGHLKVTCVSLGLDFDKELSALLELTDYIHISDNDGRADQNRRLTRQSDLYKALKGFNLEEKTITLEVYEGLDAVRESFDLLMEAAEC
jgi:sugar phosphate isomerase/epimerase